MHIGLRSPRGLGPLQSTPAGHARLFHPKGDPDPGALAFAAGLAPDPHHRLVVVDLPPGSLDAHTESLAKALAGPRGSLRLVFTGATTSRETRTAAQRVADQLGTTVVVADGEAVPTWGGGLFVPSDRGTGWTAFRPGRGPQHDSQRFPKPAWEFSTFNRPWQTSEHCVVEALPAGVWVRAVGGEAAVSGRAWLMESLPCHPDILVVVLGSPGGPAVPLADVVRYWDTVLPSVRSRVRFVHYGPISTPGGRAYGQELADRLGQQIVVYAGMPLAATTGLQAPPVVTLHKRAGSQSRPFVSELMYFPRTGGRAASPPALFGLRRPVVGVPEISTGVYEYASDAVLEVVQSGLWMRPVTEPVDADDVRSLPAGPGRLAIFYDRSTPTTAERMRALAEDMLWRLDPATRDTFQVAPADDPWPVLLSGEDDVWSIAVETAPTAQADTVKGRAPHTPRAGRAGAALPSESEAQPAETAMAEHLASARQARELKARAWTTAPAALPVTESGALRQRVGAERPRTRTESGAVPGPAGLPQTVTSETEPATEPLPPLPHARVQPPAQVSPDAPHEHPPTDVTERSSRAPETPGTQPLGSQHAPVPRAPVSQPPGAETVSRVPSTHPVPPVNAGAESLTGPAPAAHGTTALPRIRPAEPEPDARESVVPGERAEPEPDASAESRSDKSEPAAPEAAESKTAESKPAAPRPAVPRPAVPEAEPEPDESRPAAPRPAAPEAASKPGAPAVPEPAVPAEPPAPAVPAEPPAPAFREPAADDKPAVSPMGDAPAPAPVAPRIRLESGAPESSAPAVEPEPASDPRPVPPSEPDAAADADGRQAPGHVPVRPAAAGPPQVSVQPPPKAAACVAPQGRDISRERDWVRRTFSAQYNSVAGSVSRLMSEVPGLRGASRTDANDALTDLVAVKLFLSGDSGQVDRAVRSATVGPHVPLARCIASGLRRLPSYRGPSLLRTDATAAERGWFAAGRLVTEWGFCTSRTDVEAVGDGDTDFLIWSMTARRTNLLDSERADQVVFVPGTSFKVLRAQDGGERHTVLMRELLPSEIDDDGRVEVARVPLDEIALAGLDQALKIVEGAEPANGAEAAAGAGSGWPPGLVSGTVQQGPQFVPEGAPRRSPATAPQQSAHNKGAQP